MFVKRFEQASVGGLRRVHALESEIEFFAVVRVQAKISERERGVSAFFELRNCVGVAERLAHFAAVYEHELAVHPHVNRFATLSRFALRYLVFVVHGYVVYAARVDIESYAEILAAHCRALYVPTGISHAPGRLPLHNVVFFGFLP